MKLLDNDANNILAVCRDQKEAELERRFSGLHLGQDEAARQEEAEKAAALEKTRQEELKVFGEESWTHNKYIFRLSFNINISSMSKMILKFTFISDSFGMHLYSRD